MEQSDLIRRIHPTFLLNGVSYTKKSLKEQASLYVEEGEPYEEAVGTFLINWLDEKAYVLVNTSGSTGAPKPIKVQKAHMVHSALATAKHFNLPEKTTALLCLPAHYIAGKMMLVRAIVLGWHLDTAQPKVNPLDTVYKRYDFCAMTPLQLDNSLSRLHLLNKLIVGGGAIPAPLIPKIQDITTKIYETYGMTETVTHIAARRINSKKKKDLIIPFKTLNRVTVECDERGCLVIKAPHVSSDPVVTNDIVEVLTYKKFIWLGRIDNVINSGGVKLHPEQIEHKLGAIIDSPFFVAGLPDEKLGEKLVLFIEQEKPLVFPEAFERTMGLDKFEHPKEIISVPSFQRTTTGKIQRGQTVKTYLQGKP